MVGVPGKYKGCNTCRTRRVKCDNERPFCRKCLDTGRTCDGYKRETVFIIGTLQDQGRCSSHPPRVVKSSKKGKASSKKEAEKLEIVANEPLRPAWDDLISVSNAGKTYNIQNAALHTRLDEVSRRAGSNEDDGDDIGGQSNFISLPAYEPLNVQPFVSEGDFQLRSQALVHLSPLEETQGEGLPTTTDSILMFLYEHNNSTVFNNQAPWRDPTIQNDNVRRLGPGAFRTFPNHHFFVRVFRHNAICTALLNRTPTFLESPEWKTTPWELHPKTLYDQLFDIIVLLPSVLHRADRILLAEPTQHPNHIMARRLMAQDLLQNCLNIDRQFDEWWAAASHAASQNNSDMYWVEEPDDINISGGGSNTNTNTNRGGSSGVPSPSPSNTNTNSTSTSTTTPSRSRGSSTPRTRTPPFADTFAFPDALTASMCIYAWTGLVQLYLCIERLYWAAFEPDPSGNILTAYHHPPSQLQHHNPQVDAQINLLQYSLKVREMVGNICRSLDFALESTVQPDMLAVPLFVVRRFYEEHVDLDPGLNLGLGMGFGLGIEGQDDMMLGDGRLELLWCEGFAERLKRKGRDIAEVVGARRWVDLASY
ncbi:hypothetical protein V8F20_007226 [Naviculisporaceae sp. PSN 640]